MKKLDTSENQVNSVYLGLGSNLGNRKKNLEKALYLLNSLGVKILKNSSFYHTKSWPNKKFPNYFNLVVFTKTNLKLKNLFEKIKYIEKLLGRTTSPKNYPRVCDIDIIDFNGTNLLENYNKLKIIVPHKSMHKRNFVLFPLYELNKQWIHPKFKKNILKLLFNLPLKDLRGINIMV